MTIQTYHLNAKISITAVESLTIGILGRIEESKEYNQGNISCAVMENMKPMILQNQHCTLFIFALEPWNSQQKHIHIFFITIIFIWHQP